MTSISRQDTERFIETFGKLDAGQTRKALDLVERYGFNPFLHLVAYQGKVTLTIDGMFWWARTQAKERFDIVTEVVPTDQKEAYGIAEHEIGAIAKVYRMGADRPTCTGFGRASTDKASPVSRGSAVESNHPYRMAEKRAEAQALRKFLALGDVAAMPAAIESEDVESETVISYDYDEDKRQRDQAELFGGN